MHADRLGAYANVAATDGRDLAFRDGAQAFGSSVGGIFRLVLSRDDEPSLVVVVEIGVELGQEAMAARGVDGLVQRSRHAEQGGFEHVRSVTNRVRGLFVARGHSVE
jgi:hypothetical protein